MPLSLGNLYPIIACRRVKKETTDLCAGIVMKNNNHLSTQQNVCLSRMTMPVNRHYSAGQKHVYEPLRIGIKAFMEIIVHAQTGRFLRLSCYFVKKFIVD